MSKKDIIEIIGAPPEFLDTPVDEVTAMFEEHMKNIKLDIINAFRRPDENFIKMSWDKVYEAGLSPTPPPLIHPKVWKEACEMTRREELQQKLAGRGVRVPIGKLCVWKDRAVASAESWLKKAEKDPAAPMPAFLRKY